MTRDQIRYYERKKADGEAPMEAMRCVKQRLSDLVYQQMLNDALGTRTGPGGQRGDDSDSSATGSQPQHRLFGQATPGPATNQPKPPLPRVS
jgi:transposase